jgi:hypothetical protein
MLSGRYEGLLRGVTTQIILRLNVIASGRSPSADFARDIRNYGSETIKFDETEYGQHDPGYLFWTLEIALPWHCHRGVVLAKREST